MYAVDLPVQFRDLDVLGHVNSTVYLQYMETARVSFIDAVAPGHDWQRPPIIVVAARCDYLAPIAGARRITVHAWVSRIGGTSWDLDYEVVPEGGARAAIGRTTQVWYDYAQATPRPIPDAVRQALEQHQAPALRFRSDATPVTP